jgi:hypothetical protein
MSGANRRTFSSGLALEVIHQLLEHGDGLDEDAALFRLHGVQGLLDASVARQIPAMQ